MDKRHHPLDNLFRQGLTDLEISPTDAGRSGFLEKAGRELNKRSGKTGWLTIAGIILGIAILTGTFRILLNTGEKQDHKNLVETTKANQLAGNKASSPVTTNSRQDISNHSNEGTVNKQIFQIPPVQTNSGRVSQTPYSKSAALTEKEKNTSTRLASPQNDVGSTTSSMIFPASGNSQLIQDQSTSVSENKTQQSPEPPSSDSLSKNSRHLQDSIGYPETTSSKKDTVHHTSGSSHSREWNIRTGFYYTPEWIFNTLDKNKYVNNFGVEGQFRFGPYSIRTGIGLSITRGFNEIIIETMPYLGGYQALDRITYQWDSRHYHLIPTYYTTWKEVFDTAVRKNYFTLEKEYTYLQIPMVLGYDFFTEKWFSLGARVGPVMSLLLRTRELTSGYDAGKDKVISINNVTPDRIHLNWQAMGGINASVRLSRLFNFELEPEIRYYFDSVYEKSGLTDKPWSLGLRAAFLVNF